MPLANVLIVDDDEQIRNALRRDLRTLDCALHFADRASTAFEILRTEKIDIVLSDNLMPGMTGLRFLQVVRQRYPDVVRILLTGQATVATAVSAINESQVFRLLEKPWDSQELKFVLLQAASQRKPNPSP